MTSLPDLFRALPDLEYAIDQPGLMAGLFAWVGRSLSMPIKQQPHLSASGSKKKLPWKSSGLRGGYAGRPQVCRSAMSGLT